MASRRVNRLLIVFTAAIMTTVSVQSASAAPGTSAPQVKTVDYHDFHGVDPRPAGTLDYEGKTYDYAQWTSPVHSQGFDATELVASWNARTPEHTWIQVEAQGETATGARTAWFVMGRWASGDADFKRTSVDGQEDANAYVSTDTLVAQPGVTLRSYRLRLSLFHETGTNERPTVSALGAMTSNVPDRFTVPVSRPRRARGIELPVPAYAQNIHLGHYPEYGGGGESWCSPVATEMVVEYYGKRPSAEQLSWIPADHPDPTVDYAARYTYDYAYEGTGNWPFNTAYAAEFGLHGHVTRLHSLNELEDYIARGIPVITSQSFLADELDGAGYGTPGHLMVVVGFTKDGDVIANDPASSTDARVRNVYKRAQFENIWLRTKRYDAGGNVASGTGGIAYIITP